MASKLSTLLDRVDRLDAVLARDLAAEVRKATAGAEYGLVFERHVPESVELPGTRVRVRSKVRFLPPRGDREPVDRRTWIVRGISTDDAGRKVADLIDARPPADQPPATSARIVDDLVLVADFRDPIYPGFRSTGRIERGGDKPFHTVINGENYHALEALRFAYKGKVNAIYIDPPYNTRDKDWKYNNDYVDGDDIYRHSKWLAFMERRLKIAKELLNPKDSVLIVTIDEKEVHRLGLLIEQVFRGTKTQMVTITINHRGVARNREFTRVEEYAFFVFIGAAGPVPTHDDLLSPDLSDTARAKKVRWEWLIKGSNNARRVDRPKLFYPIWVDPQKARIAEVGEAIPLDADRDSVPGKPGLVPVWPIGVDGSEKRWQLAPETLRGLISEGMARVGQYDAKNDRWSIHYLNRGQRQRIERGDVKVAGRDENGVLQLEQDVQPLRAGMTVWNRPSHNAGYYGSGVLSALVPQRKFPFPKSLYAVEDTLRFAVGDKPDAIILDFFGGSGTTTHAVMRLNHQDGGRRQAILVTNNEVSAEEEEALLVRGLRPGDPEWEALGICEFITKPRVSAAVTGVTYQGTAVAGEYKFTDEFPMSQGFEENVEFLTLTYESPTVVAHNRAFAAITPLLWMRAGSRGDRIERPTDGYAMTTTYAVLFRVDAVSGFLRAVREQPNIRLAYVVTDDDAQYQIVASQLPETVEPVRLYESYLRSVEIATEEG